MEPRFDGLPEANKALTSVLRELTVYDPGRFTCPTRKTWMERSWPRVTFNSKFLNTRLMFRVSALFSSS